MSGGSRTDGKGENPIRIRKPKWLKRGLPRGAAYENIRSLMQKGGLHTVCQEAKCPNQFECFGKGTATFLIMGERCTRNCRFCNIEGGPIHAPDPGEPVKVAEAAARMNLKFVVVTSVTRDDLEDGGAHLFAETIREIRSRLPEAGIEVLIPDFLGNRTALEAVLSAGPDVLNHNIETVKRLYARVRPEAVYERSLELISRVREWPGGIPAKSGIMLGLGETDAEIRETLRDLRDHGCEILTIGQYLQPSKHHLEVDRFVPPAEFDAWKEEALSMGFSTVASGPFVRSSYQAGELLVGKRK